MTKLTTIAVDQLQSMQGTKLGISPWVQLSQLMVNQFAEITNDHQFIHTDPERAGAANTFWRDNCTWFPDTVTTHTDGRIHAAHHQGRTNEHQLRI